ncbi:type II restriction endonuclease [Segatella buccae]|uniref:type II restriction endonuclease n=1 Tax=Segatella buccae TaxID=28126 RepID=UPI003FD7509F
MSKIDFNTFLSQLKETNATLDFFCDFDKIKNYVEDVEISLNTLNFLIGQKDMESAIRKLWDRNKDCFEDLEILIAVRKNSEKKVIDEDGNVRRIKHYFESADGVITFIKETGLQKVFQDKNIKNLVDYVFGVETGLDTNARKNRSGDLMANRVASVFDNNGVTYQREINSSTLPGLEILGKDEKRFDFVIKTSKKTYLVEVNFYSEGGSKLNEVARSYSDIGPKINSLPQYEFVWITDGKGWESAKNKLEEAYSIIPDLYNLTTLEEFIEKVKAE